MSRLQPETKERLSFGVSREFVDDNIEWIRFEADSDAPDAWVFEQLLSDYEEGSS